MVSSGKKKDVPSISEFKYLDGHLQDFQAGSSMRNLFAAHPTRQFVHAFSLSRTMVHTWVFVKQRAMFGYLYWKREGKKVY